MFVVVTGDNLILGTRRFAIYSLIAICVAAPTTVSLHFQPPYLQYWQIPCYTVTYCVLGVTLCTFNIMFCSLFRAATILNNCFKVRNSCNIMYHNFHTILRASICNSSFFLHVPCKIILFIIAFSSHNLLIIIEYN